jgi:putative cardiolipin synthase
VFVGSLNMDGRSRRFNSELGLVMRSTDIAQQVTNILDDLSADGSYRLSLVDHTNQIEWFSGEPGQELEWHTDPETTLAQRMWLDALAPFAPEELL